MIRGVIFDLDGVLADTVAVHDEALNLALAPYGLRAAEREPGGEIFRGLPTKEKLKILSERAGLVQSAFGIIQQKKQEQMLRLIAERCVPDPKVDRMLLGLRARGLKLGVASNSVPETVEGILRGMGIAARFQVILSSRDVTRGKPDPEIYQLAAKRLGLAGEECAIVEDSPVGIEAARAVTSHVLVVAGPHEVTLERVLGFLQDQVL